MTCIVAVRDPKAKRVLLAGDSTRTMNGYLRTTLPKSKGKVYEVAGFVVGHTGNGRIRHLTSSLKLKWVESGPSNSFNLEAVLLEHIVPQLKKRAKDLEFLETEKGVPSLGGQILIAFGEEICQIGDDFSITPITGPYWAVGSGTYFALGSLYTSEGYGLNTKDRAILALKAAHQFTESVGPPYIWKATTPLADLRKRGK